MREATKAHSSPPNCLWCTGSSYREFVTDIQDRLQYAPGRWSYQQCTQCESAVLTPHPTHEQTATFYPKAYTFGVEEDQPSTLKQLLTSLEYRCFFKPQYDGQVNNILRETNQNPTTADSSPKRLLDIGCGRGLRLLSFRDKGFNVHGFDFQPEDVDYLQKKHNISATAGDVAKISNYFAPASFDVVSAFYLLEHVSDVHSILKQCCELLKPGGWLVGAVPLIDSLQAKIFRRNWLNITEAPRHLSLPSCNGIRKACNEAGYENVKITPDALSLCAGVAGLSLFPSAAGAHFYGGSKLKPILSRGLAAGFAAFLLPWCAIENYVLQSPSHGVIFARKRGGDR
jgi:SAM-dependent methyltransferase